MIDVFLKVINDGLRYNIKNSTLFMPAQVIQITYHDKSSYVTYIDACKDWSRNPRDEKTWDNYKMFSR